MTFFTRAYIRRTQFEANQIALAVGRMLFGTAETATPAGRPSATRTDHPPAPHEAAHSSAHPAAHREAVQRLPAHQALKLLGITPPRKRDRDEGGGTHG